MVAYIIFGIYLFSIIFGTCSGCMADVAAGAMTGAASAVDLVLSMAGAICLWCGVGEVLRRSGLRNALKKLLSPWMDRLFPELRGNRDGASALSANITANLLGLGNAATPMGIAACKSLNDGSGIPTNAQCRLIVLNSASIQLLPTTVAALRTSLGAVSPMDILPCVLLSSLCSVTVGLLACRLFEGKKR